MRGFSGSSNPVATAGLLERLVEETNTRLLKQKPALLRQQKGLQRNLAEVNAQAGSLLTEWSAVSADHGKSFVTEKLTELAERRAAIERGVAELEQQLAKVQDKAVTAEVVRTALSQVHQVYACLKPYEQRELMRLVVHRAEVHVRELVLEINGAVGQAITPATVNNGGVVRQDTGLAPRAGFEPTTCRLTAGRSTIELSGSANNLPSISAPATAWKSASLFVALPRHPVL